LASRVVDPGQVDEGRRDFLFQSAKLAGATALATSTGALRVFGQDSRGPRTQQDYDKQVKQGLDSFEIGDYETAARTLWGCKQSRSDSVELNAILAKTFINAGIDSDRRDTYFSAAQNLLREMSSKGVKDRGFNDAMGTWFKVQAGLAEGDDKLSNVGKAEKYYRTAMGMQNTTTIQTDDDKLRKAVASQTDNHMVSMGMLGCVRERYTASGETKYLDSQIGHLNRLGTQLEQDIDLNFDTKDIRARNICEIRGDAYMGLYEHGKKAGNNNVNNLQSAIYDYEEASHDNIHIISRFNASKPNTPEMRRLVYTDRLKIAQLKCRAGDGYLELGNVTDDHTRYDLATAAFGTATSDLNEAAKFATDPDEASRIRYLSGVRYLQSACYNSLADENGDFSQGRVRSMNEAFKQAIRILGYGDRVTDLENPINNLINTSTSDDERRALSDMGVASPIRLREMGNIIKSTFIESEIKKAKGIEN